MTRLKNEECSKDGEEYEEGVVCIVYSLGSITLNNNLTLFIGG